MFFRRIGFSDRVKEFQSIVVFQANQIKPTVSFKRQLYTTFLNNFLPHLILFNPRTPGQVTNIRTELKNLLEIIENKDAEGMKKYLTKIREKIK